MAGDLLQLVEFSPAPPSLDVEIAARFQVSVAALSDTLAAVTMLHTLDNFVSCDQKTKRGDVETSSAPIWSWLMVAPLSLTEASQLHSDGYVTLRWSPN